MRSRVIRDPLYGYISLPDELAPVVDHPLFQRLRRISQTSLTNTVYPAATGSRFEHALGVMHLSGRAWDAIWRYAADPERRSVRRSFIAAAREEVPDLATEPEEFGRQLRLGMAGAALLHDVGHTPFSHALEDVYRNWTLARALSEESDGEDPPELVTLRAGGLKFHEYTGRAIARRICADTFFADANGGDHEMLRATIMSILTSHAGGRTWSGALRGVIAGDIDIDRIDYLMRDSDKAAGAEFGGIDYQRLVDALELHPDDSSEDEHRFRIAPGVRARSAVETLLVQRLQSYEYIHFHPRVVGYNLALRRAFEAVLELSGGKTVVAAIQRPLARLRPNMNFWNPEHVDAKAALSLAPLTHDAATRASAEPQQSLASVDITDDDQFEAGIQSRPERQVDAAASVDDATVLETLKRAYLIVEAAPPRYKEAVAWPQLTQIQIHGRAALFREKNFVPAWKTADEYEGAAQAMRATLLDAAPAVLDERAEQASDAAVATQLNAFARYLREQGASVQASTQDRGSAVRQLNALADLLLFRPDLLRRLRDALNAEPAVDGHEGLWDIGYTGYGPVDPPTIELYAGAKRVSLIDRSPLAEAVWLAEARRVKFFVFFFFRELSFGHAGSPSAGAYRSRVRKVVEARLPALTIDLIREHA